MPRPSLKEVRTAEILDAFAECVIRYGLDGATLEKISQTAGVKRTLLRHYLGNRDEMIDRLADHVVDGFNRATDALVSALPDSGRLDALMDFLFHEHERSPSDASLFQALAGASDRYPKIRKGILDFLKKFEEAIADEIARAFPNAQRDQVRVVASGVSSIYFNVESAGPMRPDPDWVGRQRAAATLLIDCLRD